MNEAVLQVKNLSVALKDKDLFNDVNISFYPGEVVLLEGNNGVGKTTFLKTIIGLEKGSRKKEEGTILWRNSTNVLQMRDEELLTLRSRIAYLEQKDNYEGLHGITVKDIISDSYEAYKGRMTLGDKEFIEKMFQTYLPKEAGFSLKSKVSKLSGGQQRMVSIMASLCIRKDAEVFIIDEPLNNLDISSIVHISNLLNRVRLENPQALFLIISHCKIFPYINRVVRFENGSIAEDDGKIICNACFGLPDADGYYRVGN